MSLDKNTKLKVMKDFAQSAQDTGSAAVQVALITSNIQSLTEHLNTNPKDFSSKRGLLNMVAKRRSLLLYLKRHNEAQYRQVIEQLGLRK